MSTVMEIEKAIELLPVAELREISMWFNEYQAMIASSEALFAMYDEEEKNDYAKG